MGNPKYDSLPISLPSEYIEKKEKNHLWTFRKMGLFFPILCFIFFVLFFESDGGIEPLRYNFPPPVTIEATNAAAAADSHECSKIAVEIMKQNGSAVDAIIASELCVGVINSFSAGIGGGGFLIARDPAGFTKVIDFREMAPKAASKDMFKGFPMKAQRGGLAVAVPGEIKGFAEAHKLFGRLPWKHLFQPSIDLARNGFTVTKELARVMESFSKVILGNPAFKRHFAPDGRIPQEGDILKRPALANTLQLIATDGPDAFYNGLITNELVKEVRTNGGIVTEEDFRTYKANVLEPVVGTYNGIRVLTSPAPSSGPALIFALNVLEGYNLSTSGKTDPNMQRIVETLKFTYGQRSKIGDPHFVAQVPKLVNKMLDKDFACEIRSMISDDHTFPIDHYLSDYENKYKTGTTHISVIDKEGGAASLTSTINLEWGARLLNENTGIILNNEMDDFSQPNVSNYFDLAPSPNNCIEGGKRPCSSSVPTLIEKDGEVIMAVGASGGSRILSSTMLTIINALDFKMTAGNAVSEPRLHHQLSPNEVIVEFDFADETAEYLSKKGHNVTRLPQKKVKSVVQMVLREKYPGGFLLKAVSDARKGGIAAGY